MVIIRHFKDKNYENLLHTYEYEEGGWFGTLKTYDRNSNDVEVQLNFELSVMENHIKDGRLEEIFMNPVPAEAKEHIVNAYGDTW